MSSAYHTKHVSRLYKLDGPNRLRILADLPDGDTPYEALKTQERIDPKSFQRVRQAPEHRQSNQILTSQ